MKEKLLNAQVFRDTGSTSCLKVSKILKTLSVSESRADVRF